MSKTVCSSATANPPSPLDAFISEAFATADIAVRCVICEEYTPMNSHDCRAHGVFICDKCKAAIMHIRNILDNGGNVV
jgi:hypothetical protein